MKCRSDQFIAKVDAVDDASLNPIVKRLLDWAEGAWFVMETYSGEDALGAVTQDRRPFKRTLHTSMQDAMQDFYGDSVAFSETLGKTVKNDVGYTLSLDVEPRGLCDYTPDDAIGQLSHRVELFNHEIVLRREYRKSVNMSSVYTARVFEIDVERTRDAIAKFAKFSIDDAASGEWGDSEALQTCILRELESICGDCDDDKLAQIRLDVLSNGRFTFSWPELGISCEAGVNDHPQSWCTMTLRNVGDVWSGSLGGVDDIDDDSYDYDNDSSETFNRALAATIDDGVRDVIDAARAAIENVMTAVVTDSYGRSGRIDIYHAVTDAGIMHTLSNVLNHHGSGRELARALLDIDPSAVNGSVPNPRLVYRVENIEVNEIDNLLEIDADVSRLARESDCGDWDVKFTEHVTAVNVPKRVLVDAS